MAKSIQRLLIDASVLVKAARVTHQELVDVSVRSQEIQIQVWPLALVRIWGLLKPLPRNCSSHYGQNGALHLQFKSRGAKWVACALPGEPDYAHLAAVTNDRDRLPNSPRSLSDHREVLCLPAPQSTRNL